VVKEADDVSQSVCTPPGFSASVFQCSSLLLLPLFLFLLLFDFLGSSSPFASDAPGPATVSIHPDSRNQIDKNVLWLPFSVLFKYY